MGCTKSAPADQPSENAAEVKMAKRVSNNLHHLAHERLRKLEELDERTKVPFILIELTGEGDTHGEIEICGKDEYGIYEALNGYLIKKWGCTWSDPGDLSEDTQIPFCRARYLWPGFKEDLEEDINNMGKSIMKMVDFVGGQLSWTLALVSSGNVGKNAEVREVQVIFKAPHPMNLATPTLTIELRSQGFIEVCADLDEDEKGILDVLEEYFQGRFKAERKEGFDEFCDRYYSVGEGVFIGTSGSEDSNFGLLCVELADQMVVESPGWSLVATSCGSTGKSGEFSEQTFIFRKDFHPLGSSPYVCVVLNSRGDVEVNAKDVRGIHRKLDKFLKQEWKCKFSSRFEQGDTSCVRYVFPESPSLEVSMAMLSADMLGADTAMIQFFEMQGFETQLATQYEIKEGDRWCTEQQLWFRPGKTEVGSIEPHLVMELYTGEGSEELYADPDEPTQVLANSHIRYKVVGDDKYQDVISSAKGQLSDFFEEFLGGMPYDGVENCWKVNLFLCRGWYENNLAQWTMRVCDFMVDRLGWGFVVCSLTNRGEYGQIRTQQLIFHYEGDKRDLPVAAIDLQALNPTMWENTPFPEYWTIPKVIARSKHYDVTEASAEELAVLQQMCDMTYKRVLTRDRQPDDDAPEDEEMPYRLELMTAFRSENAFLHHRYSEKVTSLLSGSELVDDFPVKTKYGSWMDARLQPGEGYLYHGTNPSAAWSIMKGGFQIRHAGSSRGTMYGNGIYMAECSSKSDEYGRDDGGNTFPGLNALLVCRCFVGTPHVVSAAGDHVSKASTGGFHCVVGDRETAGPKTYREFVFFSEHQIYPEYTLIYRRQYSAHLVPESLGLSKDKATGTTGRFWQMRGDIFGFKGWKNVPAEVNSTLIWAKQQGHSEVLVDMRSQKYVFNVEEKTATDDKGNKSPLRPPMQ